MKSRQDISRAIQRKFPDTPNGLLDLLIDTVDRFQSIHQRELRDQANGRHALDKAFELELLCNRLTLNQRRGQEPPTLEAVT